MMRLSEGAAVLGARVQGDDVLFTRVATDSRTLGTGDLFVALRGEHFDGHAFVSAAADAGAAAAMVEESAIEPGEAPLPLLVVNDTRNALGRLAAHWRRRFDLPLAALTGSSGKTTVKDMLAAVLRAHAARAEGAAETESVLATRGNLNNDIGVPLMLLALRAEHRYAVIEMGMNHAGEIRYLSELAAPTVALVNNAGRAHIEFLGSEEAIARAKGEIFECLAPGGTAVINADDRFADVWRQLARDREQLDFGIEKPARVTGTFQLRADASDIVLATGKGLLPVTLHVPGVHNVYNALAATAVAVALDISLESIRVGLEQFTGVKGRLQTKRAVRGATLVDDTYNANPESMRAAIAVLSKSAGTRVLVLGDMGELGAAAPELHADLGVVAREAGIERLLTLGEHSARTAAAFGEGARHYTRIEDLLADLDSLLGPDVTVLVKGSRFMQMERVVRAFAADEGGAAAAQQGEPH
jgi:UDP-N-acetylmuramoyl-tripeptide--D-alanyl-D-alanine ligase